MFVYNIWLCWEYHVHSSLWIGNGYFQSSLVVPYYLPIPRLSEHPIRKYYSQGWQPTLWVGISVAQWVLSVAYPGVFWLPETPPPWPIYIFNQGVVTILAPTFTSHLKLRVLENPPLIPTLHTPLTMIK